MKALAVSGALNHQAVCVAAKSEERRLENRQKRKHYQSPQLRERRQLTSLKFLLLVEHRAV